MARTDNLGNFLTDIANAIRNKTGGTASLKPANFDTEISNIKSGSKYPPITLNTAGTSLSTLLDCGAYFNDMDELVIYVIPSYTSYENVTFKAGTPFIGTKWLGWDLRTHSDGNSNYEPHCCFLRGLSNCKGLSVTISAGTQYSSNDCTEITISVSELSEDPGTRSLIYTQSNYEGDLTVSVSGESSTRILSHGQTTQIPIGATVNISGNGLQSAYTSGIHTYQYSWFKPDSLVRTLTATNCYQFVMPETTVSVHSWITGCFIAGTPVLMADNSYKNIEYIKSGDKVMCYDDENDTITTQEIIDIFVREYTSLIEFTTENGVNFTSTDTHEIYSESAQGYVPAKDLHVGEILKTTSGTVKIADIKLMEQETTVYNLNVEEHDNYFVSHDNILVHNVS